MAYIHRFGRRVTILAAVPLLFFSPLKAVETIPKVTADIEAIPLNLLPKALRRPRKARVKKALN